MNCRGLLARSIMQAQAASPTFTHVYAALVAIINTKVSFTLTFDLYYLLSFMFWWLSCLNITINLCIIIIILFFVVLCDINVYVCIFIRDVKWALINRCSNLKNYDRLHWPITDIMWKTETAQSKVIDLLLHFMTWLTGIVKCSGWPEVVKLWEQRQMVQWDMQGRLDGDCSHLLTCTLCRCISNVVAPSELLWPVSNYNIPGQLGWQYDWWRRHIVEADMRWWHMQQKW